MALDHGTPRTPGIETAKQIGAGPEPLAAFPLLYRFSRPGIVAWSESEAEWWDTDADQFGFPTHWMPLLEAPSLPVPVIGEEK